MQSEREIFGKSERLCSKKIIADLFEKGKIFYSSPFKVIWIKIQVPLPFPAQVAFSIPKKGFRFAVSRNLIRRRMKEGYRKNKYILYDYLNSDNTKVAFIVIYRKNSILNYLTIEKSMKEMINKFICNLKE